MSTTTPDPSSSPLLLQDPTAPALVLSTTPPSDPPPPYPSGRRTRQARTGRRRRTHLDTSEHSHVQAPSDEYEALSTTAHGTLQCATDGADDTDAGETTPLLSPNPNSPRTVLPAGTMRRRRTLSLTSTLRSSASLAPSFAQTIFSAFHPERDSDLDPDCHADGGENEELEPELESPVGSVYKNAYAMFTDPTSYQALFYFLVLKPGITVLMFLLFLALVPLGVVLVFPLPAVLRLARRMGIWQANVAVEGLYFAAR
ncbi:hypothetical protein BN946_scf184585.g11 [Trametes cinnabarina]|uniref:Uncharacterized protein n=1 Tax=Pycnoporus cinnabarinus TaxID=5643 RepID=A0A060STB0_PYCCI|nr:hypothetical protein BN946_scf184585.g11 [Trametes cinnabarina]